MRARVCGSRTKRPERRAAGRPRPGRDHGGFRGDQPEPRVPVGRQPGQPLPAERRVHGAGDGGDVRPPAGRDRPVYRLCGGVRRGDRCPARPTGDHQLAVVGRGAILWFANQRRRRSGLVAPPVSLTVIKIGVIAGAGVVVVAISDINRANFGTLAGVPWVVPIVLAVLGAWTILLERTKYGRYVYASGGNPEAARRAGINLSVIRTVAFALCSMTAGIGVLLYASYIGGMSNNVQGGQFVLFAVAAAVIGGTSLFGGRGKVIHGVLGGLLIGGINNGMYLQGLDVQRIFIVTGLVLLAAVTIDAVSRRAAASGSAARV